MADTIKILTLLNVAAAKPTKRQRPSSRDWYSEAKKVKAKPARTGKAVAVDVTHMTEAQEAELDELAEVETTDETVQDAYERHWTAESPLVKDITLEELATLQWKKTTRRESGLGAVSELNVVSGTVDVDASTNIYNARLMAKLKTYMTTVSPRGSITSTQEAILKTLASYRDIFYPKMDIAHHDEIRAAISVHAINHVMKTRAKVLKNNDHLIKAALPNSTAPARDTRDQGFARPKVLVLLPFRNSATAWINHLTTLSVADTIENKARFDSEYSLPEGAVDKLLENPEAYSADHVDTFGGNIDDSFRIGLKVTRKSVKLFAEFYSCDIIVASPLGLRTSIEKEKDSDFLSSIELLVVDQMDVMLMQNFDHVQFVLDRMNKLPEEAHGCDFSRVKPWYLDGKSAHLRQSILLSAFETPELRSLYSKSLVNVAGKVRTEVVADGVMTAVPSGLKQVFTRFETADLFSEEDSRFEFFTTKTLPMLLKSAVSSSQTIIFIPSYFDFVRVKRYMTKMDNFSFTSISEYTPTPEVSRARGAFFAGKKSFLLITERFHFFRRYRIRGAKTFVFYAPPDHAHYYPEVLSFPFNRSKSNPLQTLELEAGEEQVDESELSCQILFSKFDLLRLERICGTEDAKRMVTESDTRFTFL